jgi:hypothetical protein
MANEVAVEEGLQELCHFFQVDVTIDPNILLNGKHPNGCRLEYIYMKFLTNVSMPPHACGLDYVAEETCTIATRLENVSVVFLYTYPTLLAQVIPLLKRLCSLESLRAIVTLRYHIPNVEADQEDVGQELRWYTCVTPEQQWLRDAVRASTRRKNSMDELELEC